MSIVVIVIQTDDEDENQIKMSTFADPPLPVGEPQSVDAAQAMGIAMLNSAGSGQGFQLG